MQGAGAASQGRPATEGTVRRNGPRAHFLCPFFGGQAGAMWPEVTDAARPAARAARAGRGRPRATSCGSSSTRRGRAADCCGSTSTRPDGISLDDCERVSRGGQRGARRGGSDAGPLHARGVVAGAGPGAAHARALRALRGRAGASGDDAADRRAQAVYRAVARRSARARSRSSWMSGRVSLPIEDIHKARLAPHVTMELRSGVDDEQRDPDGRRRRLEREGRRQGDHLRGARSGARVRHAQDVTARTSTCASRSTARPATTTRSAAGRCSPTTRPSSSSRSASCASKTRSTSSRRPRSAASSKCRWSRSRSAASPRRPRSRSSCRRCARPSARRSSTSTRTASARWCRGIVKRVDRNGVFVDLGGNAEGFVPREQMIPREPVRSQDRIKAFLQDVRSEPRGPQLFLTRTAPEFLIELFKLEVPEVGQGLIKILGAARDPGVRAKIAVKSNDRASTRSARASACAARACRRCRTRSPASASTSSRATRTRRSSSSTRWRRPR